MNKEEEIEEKVGPLLIGKNFKGQLVIRKGDQEITVLAWELKTLKRIIDQTMEV